MIRIGIIVGSTRPCRNGGQVAAWVQELAYIFVTPEYNGGTPASLQNAINHLHQEWTRKTGAYVGYGVFGAVTAVHELRAQAGRLQMADIGPQVALSLGEDFVDNTEFKPQDLHIEEVHKLVDELLGWNTALAPLPGPSHEQPQTRGPLGCRARQPVRNAHADGPGPSGRRKCPAHHPRYPADRPSVHRCSSSQPHSAGPPSSAAPSRSSCAPLSRHTAPPGPLDARAATPQARQRRRHAYAEFDETRSRRATSGGVTRAAGTFGSGGCLRTNHPGTWGADPGRG